VRSIRVFAKKPIMNPLSWFMINAESWTGREKIAINNQNYHQEIPAIGIIANSGQSKRAHSHSYNANSGVGVIFGVATKKLLYMGVHSNYCAVC